MFARTVGRLRLLEQTNEQLAGRIRRPFLKLPIPIPIKYSFRRDRHHRRGRYKCEILNLLGKVARLFLPKRVEKLSPIFVASVQWYTRCRSEQVRLGETKIEMNSLKEKKRKSETSNHIQNDNRV